MRLVCPQTKYGGQTDQDDENGVVDVEVAGQPWNQVRVASSLMKNQSTRDRERKGGRNLTNITQTTNINVGGAVVV